MEVPYTQPLIAVLLYIFISCFTIISRTGEDTHFNFLQGLILANTRKKDNEISPKWAWPGSCDLLSLETVKIHT